MALTGVYLVRIPIDVLKYLYTCDEQEGIPDSVID
jgi:hypothetical protein